MSYCAYYTNILSSDQNVDIGGVVHCPPKAPTVAAKRTYVGLIHIIEDDNEYESFFIDPTFFWLSVGQRFKPRLLLKHYSVVALKW